MAPSLPRLTEADVKRYIASPYFERGQSYYRNGHIFDTARRGNQLEGYCEGSAPEPYRIVVTLEKNGISYRCSCPMGGGCKHTAALLLAWVHHPDSFSAREPIDQTLASKDKDELIALIQEMLKREPELERLLDLPIPGKTKKGEKRRTPVDPETYRRQIRYAMRDAGDWDALSDIAGEISSIVDLGDQFAEQDDWENAEAVYQAVLDEALPDYGSMQDEGEVGSEIGRAIEGLGRCLATRAEDTEARQAILESLFEVLEWDIAAGGIGMSDEVPGLLEQHATTEDRQEIRKWIITAIKKITGDSWTQNYHREVWGRLLASFSDDDEDFLKQAEKQGLHRPWFEKLVDLGRVAEALEVAGQHLAQSAWGQLQAVETLYAAGYKDEAFAFAKTGLPDEKDGRLAEWVAQESARRGDQATALEIYLARWKVRPELEFYEIMEKLAKKLKQWEALRPRLLTQLEQSNNRALLVDIYLHDKEWDAAWSIAEKEESPRQGWGWGWQGLPLKVAEASEKQRPAKAIPVYLDTAERLIEQQGRQNYANAAQYLSRARDLLKATKRSDEWELIITSLRERHRSKPALQDELRKAKL